jgi:quercetin dioxygenase-like cupin family protein
MKYTVILLLTAMLFTSCNTQNTTEKLSENSLSAKIEYGDKMATKTIFESHYQMILFAMKKGQDLKPHSAPMAAPLVMLEGSAKVTIGNKETIVNKGDIITLPKEIMHGIYPVTDCKFLLIK